MKIRNAFIADSDEIAALAAELGFSVGKDEFRRRLAWLLDRPGELVAVATVDDKVEGWLHAHTSMSLGYGQSVEIVAMVVAWRFRRRGAGGGLVRRAEAWGKEARAETIHARCNSKRVEGHSFFPAVGFLLSSTEAVYSKQLPLETGQKPW